MEGMINVLKIACQKSLEQSNMLDELVRENNLENEQWFLDWQDKLNEISVR